MRGTIFPGLTPNIVQNNISCEKDGTKLQVNVQRSTLAERPEIPTKLASESSLLRNQGSAENSHATRRHTNLTSKLDSEVPILPIIHTRLHCNWRDSDHQKLLEDAYPLVP